MYSEKGEINITQSADGTRHFEFNATGSDTGTRSGVPLSETYTVHDQANGGQTVCITRHFHYANGEVRFGDRDTTPGAC